VRYTRYADDLAFSCRIGPDRAHVERFRRFVLAELSREGFRRNLRKTVIRGAGTRLIVLGVLVDGPTPKLPREFKNMLRMHLYYLTSPEFGPSKHAERLRMSVSTLHHRVRGLTNWMGHECRTGAWCRMPRLFRRGPLATSAAAPARRVAKLRRFSGTVCR
jgi:RNA-directed DNA polymerase